MLAGNTNLWPYVARVHNGNDGYEFDNKNDDVISDITKAYYIRVPEMNWGTIWCSDV